MSNTFQLTRLELTIILTSMIAFVYTGSLVIKQHYLIVYNAYSLSRLQDRVKRSDDILKNLQVERSLIVTPEYLEQAAGRGGYTQPKQEQLILLNQISRGRQLDRGEP